MKSKQKNKYRTYLTRKMPQTLHARLRVLAVIMQKNPDTGKDLTLEETLNKVLAVGLEVMERKMGLGSIRTEKSTKTATMRLMFLPKENRWEVL